MLALGGYGIESMTPAFAVAALVSVAAFVAFRKLTTK